MALEELQKLRKLEVQRAQEFEERDQRIAELEQMNADKDLQIHHLQRTASVSKRDFKVIQEELKDRSNYLATQHWIIKYLLQKNKETETEINLEIAMIQDQAKISDLCKGKAGQRLHLVEQILNDSKSAILNASSIQSRSPKPRDSETTSMFVKRSRMNSSTSQDVTSKSLGNISRHGSKLENRGAGTPSQSQLCKTKVEPMAASRLDVTQERVALHQPRQSSPSQSPTPLKLEKSDIIAAAQASNLVLDTSLCWPEKPSRGPQDLQQVSACHPKKRVGTRN